MVSSEVLNFDAEPLRERSTYCYIVSSARARVGGQRHFPSVDIEGFNSYAELTGDIRTRVVCRLIIHRIDNVKKLEVRQGIGEFSEKFRALSRVRVIQEASTLAGVFTSPVIYRGVRSREHSSEPFAIRDPKSVGKTAVHDRLPPPHPRNLHYASIMHKIYCTESIAINGKTNSTHIHVMSRLEN